MWAEARVPLEHRAAWRKDIAAWADDGKFCSIRCGGPGIAASAKRDAAIGRRPCQCRDTADRTFVFLADAKR
jgi:hypothetical protein